MNPSSNDNINKKVSNSLKWTSIAEIFSKIVSPITNMVLARLISSEIFGIVASVQVVVSFAEMISEGGYAKFILQKKFTSDDEKKSVIGTGLIFSLSLGILLFLILLLFRNQLASLVKAEGYEWLLVLAGFQLPFYSIVNILISICRRNFNFKILTFIRISSVFLQFIISVCLAFFNLELWAVTIASLTSIVFQVLVLVFILRKQLSFKFSLKAFKESWSTSSGFLVSAFATWLCTSVNTIFASYFIGQSEAGILKNGFGTVAGIISMLTAIYSPVLISFLSKLSIDNPLYKKTFYTFQKVASSVFIPLGFGMFVFQDFLCDVFFGSGWEDAAVVIGCIGFMNCFKICSSDFVSVLYNAQGKPAWIVLSDGLYAVVLIGVWFCFGHLPFNIVVLSLGASIFVPIFLNIALCKRNTGISPIPIILNVVMAIPFAALMALFGYFCRSIYTSFVVNFAYIVICIVYYFCILLFSDEKYFFDYYLVFGIKTFKKINFESPYARISRKAMN